MRDSEADQSKRNLTTWVQATVHPSSEELADIFWAMDAEEQAGFFSRLAEVSGSRLPMQLAYVTDHPVLTFEGRRSMETIGEFGPEGEGQ